MLFLKVNQNIFETDEVEGHLVPRLLKIHLEECSRQMGEIGEEIGGWKRLKSLWKCLKLLDNKGEKRLKSEKAETK